MTYIKNTNQNFNLKARRTYGKSILAAAVSLALFSSGQVLAKTNVLMEEVMVTAQKKSSAEAVQDVPIAISAYSGDKVEAMFAVTLTDIGTSSPNTSLAEQGTVPHTGNFIIRGMGTTGQRNNPLGSAGASGVDPGRQQEINKPIYIYIMISV